MNRLRNALSSIAEILLESAYVSVVLCGSLFLLALFLGVAVFGLAHSALDPAIAVLSYAQRLWLFLYAGVLCVKIGMAIPAHTIWSSNGVYFVAADEISREEASSEYTPHCPKCGNLMSWTGGELNCQVERHYCSHCLF